MFCKTRCHMLCVQVKFIVRRERTSAIDVNPYYAVACSELVAYTPSKLKVCFKARVVLASRCGRRLNWRTWHPELTKAGYGCCAQVLDPRLDLSVQRRELCRPSKKFGMPRVWVQRHAVHLMRDGSFCVLFLS